MRAKGSSSATTDPAINKVSCISVHECRVDFCQQTVLRPLLACVTRRGRLQIHEQRPFYALQILTGKTNDDEKSADGAVGLEGVRVLSGRKAL